MTSRDDIVLGLIAAAAERGRLCPSNNDIADACGLARANDGSKVLQRLEKSGLIRVERGSHSRVVTIVASGLRTAGEVKNLHWRFRPENAHRRHLVYRAAGWKAPSKAISEPAPVPGSRVDRDPCPRCGVRGDIGCEHARVPFLAVRL